MTPKYYLYPAAVCRIRLFSLVALLIGVGVLQANNCCFDVSHYKTCDQHMGSNTPSYDPLPNIVITECSDELLRFRLEEIGEKKYGFVHVEVVCTNQSSLETVQVEVVATELGKNIDNGCICDFRKKYLEAPGIECSLEGCGRRPDRKFENIAAITCYDVQDSSSSSMDEPHSTPLVITGTNTNISSYPSSNTQTSYSAMTTKITTSNSISSSVFDEPEPSVTGSLSHPDATTTEWVTVISRNSKDSLEAATISTHNPSTANFLLMLSESSSFSIRSSYSNLNNSHLPNSSSNSADPIVILVAVVLSVLCVGIACAIVMSGFILYRTLSKSHKKTDDVVREESTAVKKMNELDIDLILDSCSIVSVSTTVHDLSLLQDSDNINGAFTEEVSSAGHTIDHSGGMGQHHKSSVALTTTTLLHCEDSPPTVNAAAPASVGDVSIVTQECLPEEGTVNYEWEGTRPRSTDPTTSYQPCTTDGYHGSIASYFSLRDIYHPESNYDNAAYVKTS